jgi:hypothetical protein
MWFAGFSFSQSGLLLYFLWCHAVTHIHDNASTILHHKRYRVGGSTIKRELLLDLNHVAAHDLITLSAYPGDTHDCDSVRIVEWRFWRREDAHDLGLG